jgi:hypothetical protein
MNPLQFEEQYHSIAVSYSGQGGLIYNRKVDVHIYLQTSSTAELHEKDVIVSAISWRLCQAGGLRMIDISPEHRMMVARAFYGKGSPSDCKVTLEHAIRFNRVRPERIQEYCDRTGRIGVDCSGFVNNYLMAKGLVTREKNISQYAMGRDRQNMNEIQPDDVLIWTNRFGHVKSHPSAHIALVHSPPDRQGHAVIVESAHSLHGLTHSTYMFSMTRPGVFRVERPSGHGFVKVYSVR